MNSRFTFLQIQIILIIISFVIISPRVVISKQLKHYSPTQEINQERFLLDSTSKIEKSPSFSITTVDFFNAPSCHPSSFITRISGHACGPRMCRHKRLLAQKCPSLRSCANCTELGELPQNTCLAYGGAYASFECEDKVAVDPPVYSDINTFVMNTINLSGECNHPQASYTYPGDGRCFMAEDTAIRMQCNATNIEKQTCVSRSECRHHISSCHTQNFPTGYNSGNCNYCLEKTKSTIKNKK